jgi:hypothetical protein
MGVLLIAGKKISQITMGGLLKLEYIYNGPHFKLMLPLSRSEKWTDCET